MKKAYMALLAAFVSCAIGARPATAHEPPRLVEYLSSDEWTADSLSADQAATLESIRSDPAAIDVRIGQAYPGAVRIAGALSLVVPPASGAAADVSVSFHDLDIELRSEHDYSLHARDETSGSEVSLVVMEPDVLGTIRRGADEYRVHPLGKGLTAVYRYDSSRLELQSEDDVAAGEAKDRYFASTGDTDRPPGPPTASEDGVAAIDVLFAYTWQARIESGNVGALFRHAVDQTNRIFANSRIRARLRLVYSYQTGYAQHEDSAYRSSSLAVSRRRSTGRGTRDARSVRSGFRRADARPPPLLVRIFVLLFQLPPGTGTRSAVVAQNCIGNYSLARALGRSLGAGNDYEPPIQNAAIFPMATHSATTPATGER